VNTKQTLHTASARQAAGVKRYRIAKRPSSVFPVGTPIVRPQLNRDGSPLTAPLLRQELGHVLRSIRLRQRRTLREVSTLAKVSLGYLSEVERGQKEASSELLTSICDALGMPLWAMLREVSDRIAAQEGAWIPDTPDDLLDDTHAILSGR
jgi:transcriptional regulator with XRE-family HTH domain